MTDTARISNQHKKTYNIKEIIILNNNTFCWNYRKFLQNAQTRTRTHSRCSETSSRYISWHSNKIKFIVEILTILSSIFCYTKETEKFRYSMAEV